MSRASSTSPTSCARDCPRSCAERVDAEARRDRAGAPRGRRRPHPRLPQRPRGERRRPARRRRARCCPSTASTSTASSPSPPRSCRSSTRCAGPSTSAGSPACAQTYARARELDGRLAELRELAAHRERELGLLEFELGEIDALAPQAAEHERLLAARERLRHADALAGAAGAAAEALSARERRDARRGRAAGWCRRLARATWQGPIRRSTRLAERLRAAAIESQELAGELREYGARRRRGPRHPGSRADARVRRRAARGTRAAAAQARRQRRGRARVRRDGPRTPRGAGRRRGRDRERRARARAGACGSGRPRRRAARGAPQTPRPASPTAVVEQLRSLAMERRELRRRARRGASPDRVAPTPSSS